MALVRGLVAVAEGSTEVVNAVDEVRRQRAVLQRARWFRAQGA